MPDIARATLAIQTPNVTMDAASATRLSAALSALGHRRHPATLEWLYAYPAARPLLRALETSFPAESALSIEDVRHFKQLKARGALLPASDVVRVAAVLKGREVPGVPKAREEALRAARERVEVLKIQKDALRDVIEGAKVARGVEEKTMVDHEVVPEGLSALRRAVELVRRLLEEDGCADIGDDTRVHLFVAAERELERVCAREARRQWGGVGNDADAVEIDVLVGAFADAVGDKCIYEARLARSTAVLTALRSGSLTKELASVASLSATVADTHTRWDSPLYDKIVPALSKSAEESLRLTVKRLETNDRIESQERRINAARSWILRFVEQRLRISCLAEAVHVQSQAYDKLSASLQNVCRLSALRKNSRSLPTAVDDTLSGTLDLKDTITSALGPQCECDTCCNELAVGLGDPVSAARDASRKAQKLEASCYLSQRNSSTELLLNFRESAGRDFGWLNLETDPSVLLALNELQEALGKNGRMLDALLRERSSRKHSPQTQSSNGDEPVKKWVNLLLQIERSESSTRSSCHSSQCEKS